MASGDHRIPKKTAADIDECEAVMNRYDRVTGAEIHPGTGRIVHIGLGDSAIDGNGVALARIEICDGIMTKTAG